jgi:hypothetical protein
LEKVNPYIDRAVDTANNVIDAVGSRTGDAISSLTSTANNAADYLKNGFAQYTDTANELKSKYLDAYSKAKDLTDTQLSTNLNRGGRQLEKFASDTTAQGIEGIDEHVSTIRDLLSQGSRQSLAQAGTLFENLKANVKTIAPYQKIKKAQADIEDAKVSAEQQKADVLNGLEESRADVLDKIQLSQQRLAQATKLKPNDPTLVSAGVSKEEAITSVKRDIDNQNLDLEGKISDAHKQLGDIDIATSNKITDLSSQIDSHSEDIIEAAGGVSTDLLARLNTGFRSAASAVSDRLSAVGSAVSNAAGRAATAVGEQLTNVGNAASKAASAVGEGISVVRTAIAPVTDVVGALMTPVAVWQGALSAQNLVEGHDNGNMESLANDAVNVRFGVGASKQIVQGVAGKVRSLIGGEQTAEEGAEKGAEQATTDIAKTEAEQLAETTGESAGKSAGTAAGEGIAEGLAEGAGEDVAEVGLGDLALNAIPVVGEIADVAMAGFALYEGFKGLFDPSTPPPPPPPPPAITQSVSFHGQAGVY